MDASTATPAPPAAHGRAGWPLAAACGLAVASVVVVTIAHRTGMTAAVADAPVIEQRSLRFVDQADGSIAVVDASDGRQVESVVGESGFVRGTLRGLVRERRRQGIGAEPPFALMAHADGRLTLFDAATGRRVDLASFGPTNAAAFARMLAAPRITAAAPRPRS